MRRLSFPEIAGQIILVVLFAALIFDLDTALNAVSCSHPDPGHDCYPWGIESPWYYRSKELYVGSAFVQLIGILFATLTPFQASSTMSGLLAMTVIAVSGFLVIPAIGLFL